MLLHQSDIIAFGYPKVTSTKSVFYDTYHWNIPHQKVWKWDGNRVFYGYLYGDLQYLTDVPCFVKKMYITSITPLSSITTLEHPPSIFSIPDFECSGVFNIVRTIPVTLIRTYKRGTLQYYVYELNLSSYINKNINFNFLSGLIYQIFKNDIDIDVFTDYYVTYASSELTIPNKISLPWNESQARPMWPKSMAWNATLYDNFLGDKSYHGYTLAEKKIKGGVDQNVAYSGVHNGQSFTVVTTPSIHTKKTRYNWINELTVGKYQVGEPQKIIIFLPRVSRCDDPQYMGFYCAGFFTPISEFLEGNIHITLWSNSQFTSYLGLLNQEQQADFIEANSLASFPITQLHANEVKQYIHTPSVNDINKKYRIYNICKRKNGASFFRSVSAYSNVCFEVQRSPCGLSLPIFDGQNILFPKDQDSENIKQEEIQNIYEDYKTITPPGSLSGTNKYTKIVVHPPIVPYGGFRLFKIQNFNPIVHYNAERYLPYPRPFNHNVGSIRYLTHILYTHNNNDSIILSSFISGTSSIDEIFSFPTSYFAVAVDGTIVFVNYNVYTLPPGTHPGISINTSPYNKVKENTPFTNEEIIMFIKNPPYTKRKIQLNRDPYVTKIYYVLSFI